MTARRTSNRRPRRMRVRGALLALCVSVSATTGCGEADAARYAERVPIASYPQQDVTMIVPFGAGGGSDILSRTLASVIADMKLLPRQVLIENRPGASGAVGYNHVAQHFGSPYMLATLSVSFFTTPLLGGSPVNYDDFTPVAAIAMSPYIMAVRADSPIRTLADIKGRKRLTTGTTGAGSDAVLLAHMLKKESGVRIDPVPFDGEGEIMTATLGGHIDFLFGNPGEILPQIEAGTLRPVAVSTATRLQSLPDVPSFTELGYDVQHVQLRGIVMPAGVQPDVVARWEEILRQVATSDLWRQRYLDRFKDEPYFVPGAEFAKVIQQTNRLYAGMLAELGFVQQ